MVTESGSHASREEVAEHLRRAEHHLRRAIELDPTIADDAMANLAHVRLANKRYGPTIVFIEDLLKQADQKCAGLLTLYLGVAYREMGEYVVAQHLFQSLLEGDLPTTLVRRHIAVSYLCQDEPGRALSELRGVSEVGDPHIDDLLIRAVTAEVQRRTDEAVLIYRELASACMYDGQSEILGINMARRAARLAGRGHPDAPI